MYDLALFCMHIKLKVFYICPESLFFYVSAAIHTDPSTTRDVSVRPSPGHDVCSTRHQVHIEACLRHLLCCILYHFYGVSNSS